MRRIAAAALAALVVACGATPPATATARATAAANTTPAATVVPTAATTAGAARPAFMTYAFTDVRDGSKFTLSDFSGKSVLVIGMAVW